MRLKNQLPIFLRSCWNDVFSFCSQLLSEHAVVLGPFHILFSEYASLIYANLTKPDI
jgi:hypothetical protein